MDSLKRILVIGGTGLLGKVLLEEWQGVQILGTGSRDCDITENAQVVSLLGDYRPQCTVLAAAFTDVDACETQRERAFAVNAIGASNVAQAVRTLGSRLIFLSTDYVFDGSKDGAYEPSDRICPLNVYGESKAEGERLVRETMPDACIVRTSWLFGAQGRCFPNTILSLAESRPDLRVVSDQRGCPTYNRDLARVISHLEAVRANGTVHATNSGACSWFEFARELVVAAGLTRVNVEPVASAGFPRPAKRPRNSVLSLASLQSYGLKMRHWREAANDYLKERATARGLG